MDYFTPLPAAETDINFASSTLILPQPSLASLPQLAVDLLVHNLGWPLVGYLGLRDHIPAVAGIDSVDGDTKREGVTLAVEVYHSVEQKVTLVLPRSPVIKARKQNHVASIKAFIEAAQFTQVLIVGSVDAAMRGDEALAQPTPLRTLAPRTTTSSSSDFTSRLSSIPPYTTASSSSDIPLLPAAGLTRPLLSTIPQASGLLIYAAEGGTTEPAHLLAGALAYLVGIEAPGEAGWKEPNSWERGIFGDELGRQRGGELYG